MKEATGELNITVITVVAIALVAALFYVFIWPNVRLGIAQKTCAAQFGSTGTAYTNCVSSASSVKSPDEK